MSATVDQYGVFGHPVSHSLSPFIHGLFARTTGQQMTYRAYDVPPEDFNTRVRTFFAGGGRGLNITLPHKLAAAGLADELTERATHAAAVNTLARQDDKLLGDNTDGIGLVRDLCNNLQVVVTGSRLLILGAGGASRGILAPLLALAPAMITIANRTRDRAVALAAAFAELGPCRGIGFEQVDDRPFDLIINATAASLSGGIPPIRRGAVGRSTVCYDLAYGRSANAFLKWAQECACARAVQGIGMLVEQAAESFHLWRGVRPQTEPVLAALNERPT